jgi:hypothetical protein
VAPWLISQSLTPPRGPHVTLLRTREQYSNDMDRILQAQDLASVNLSYAFPTYSEFCKAGSSIVGICTVEIVSYILILLTLQMMVLNLNEVATGILPPQWMFQNGS